MTILRYYFNKKGEKVYTLSQNNPENLDEKTKDAHYKYLRFSERRNHPKG